jgi:tetratricopeptide (TPR) repeat protein
VASIFKYEYQARQKTRAFYVHVFLPWAAKMNLRSDPAHWLATLWEDVEDALRGYDNPYDYPWRPYARIYDWFAVRRSVQEGKLDEALALLREMTEEEGYRHELAEVWRWRGRCEVALGRPQAALDALNQSLRIEPNHPESYRWRGEAYRALKQETQAEADFQKARQLEKGR